MCSIKPHVSRTVKKKNFIFSNFCAFICLTTEEKARKNLHSVCCTANIVVLTSLRVVQADLRRARLKSACTTQQVLASS